MQAHPRSRGENEVPATTGLTLGGSSPLTRGKRVAVGGRGYARGLIPAHAGKTVTHGPPPRPPAAHPRSRGENLSRPRTNPSGGGSSPLTRGKHVPRARIPGGRGLIPAHAGKTRPSISRPLRCKAHPRSRGENLSEVATLETASGSSPLTRGKPEVFGLGDN